MFHPVEIFNRNIFAKKMEPGVWPLCSYQCSSGARWHGLQLNPCFSWALPNECATWCILSEMKASGIEYSLYSASKSSIVCGFGRSRGANLKLYYEHRTRPTRNKSSHDSYRIWRPFRKFYYSAGCNPHSGGQHWLFVSRATISNIESWAYCAPIQIHRIWRDCTVFLGLCWHLPRVRTHDNSFHCSSWLHLRGWNYDRDSSQEVKLTSNFDIGIPNK
jgi:hypothetical protein